MKSTFCGEPAQLLDDWTSKISSLVSLRLPQKLLGLFDHRFPERWPL